MRRRLLAVTVAASVPFTVAGVAHAAPDEFVLSATAGPAGASVTVSDDEGECAPPDTATDPYVAVVLFAEEDALEGNDAALDESGNFRLSFTVPAGTAAGEYTVAVACFEGNSEDEEPFFVFSEQAFTVTGTTPSPTATATATPKPTATASPTATARATAPARTSAPAKSAATAVAGQPSFTG